MRSSKRLFGRTDVQLDPSSIRNYKCYKFPNIDVLFHQMEGNTSVTFNPSCTMCGSPTYLLVNENEAWDVVYGHIISAVCADCEQFKRTPNLLEIVETRLEGFIREEKLLIQELFIAAGFADSSCPPHAQLTVQFLRSKGFLVEITKDDRLCVIAEGKIPYEKRVSLVSNQKFESVGYGRGLLVPMAEYFFPIDHSTHRTANYRPVEPHQKGVIDVYTKYLENLRQHEQVIFGYQAVTAT